MGEEDNQNPNSFWQGMYSNPEFFQNPEDWSGKKAFEFGMGRTSPAKDFYSTVWSLNDDMNNSAQGAEKTSNALMDAHKAVLDLSQGQYAGFEKDIRGNIIGATGREYRDPVSGKVLGKTADWKADVGGISRPYTPGLDAFKQAQIESKKRTEAAASTPEAIQAEQNRKKFLESQYGVGKIPMSSLSATQQTRVAAGQSPFAEMTKKKQDQPQTV